MARIMFDDKEVEKKAKDFFDKLYFDRFYTNERRYTRLNSFLTEDEEPYESYKELQEEGFENEILGCSEGTSIILSSEQKKIIYSIYLDTINKYIETLNRKRIKGDIIKALEDIGLYVTNIDLERGCVEFTI